MKISVVMPVYNAEKWLACAIRSVINQTFSDWELICVNDGSTDSSACVLQKFASEDERIRILDKVNSGPGAARNSALEFAKGELIVFLDSDDVLAPIAFTEIVRADNGVDIIGFDKGSFDGDEPKFNMPICAEYVEVYRLDTISKAVFDRSLWQYAYRRDIIDGVCFADYIRGEDKLFQLQCFNRAHNIAIIKIPLYYYRCHNTSLTRRPWSFLTLRDELCWRLDWIGMINRGESKLVDKGIFGGHGIFLMEQCPTLILRLSSARERLSLLSQWYAALPVFLILPFGLLQKLVLRSIIMLPKQIFVIRVLCVVPYVCRRMVSRVFRVHIHR